MTVAGPYAADQIVALPKMPPQELANGVTTTVTSHQELSIACLAMSKTPSNQMLSSGVEILCLTTLKL